MKCIYCSGKTGVINSRLQLKQNQVWRRRQCHKCKAIFTTQESVTGEQSLTVQKGNDYEPFSRDKLLLSVYDSLRHRKTALSDATSLTGTVWSQLLPHIKNASIKREDIVGSTFKVLSRFDKAAATHYLAYHPLR